MAAVSQTLVPSAHADENTCTCSYNHYPTCCPEECECNYNDECSNFGEYDCGCMGDLRCTGYCSTCG
jgi:hypothetical protein